MSNSLYQKLKNLYPEEVEAKDSEELISQLVEKAWDEEEFVILPFDKYKDRHHLSAVYIRQWAHLLEEGAKRNKNPKLTYFSIKEGVSKNVDISSKYFIYDINDPLRYTDRAEVFLNKLVENKVGSGFTKANKYIIDSRDMLLSSTTLKGMNAITKIELAIYIAAQWGKSEHTRMFLSQNGGSPIDEKLKEIIVLGAQRLFQQSWTWVESKDRTIPLYLDPVIPYSRPVTDVFANNLEEFSEKERSQQYTSIASSHFTLFPYNRNILIVISDYTPYFLREILAPISPGEIIAYSNRLINKGTSKSDHYFVGSLSSHKMHVDASICGPVLIGFDDVFFNEYNRVAQFDQTGFFLPKGTTEQSANIQHRRLVEMTAGFDDIKDYYQYLKNSNQVAQNATFNELP